MAEVKDQNEGRAVDANGQMLVTLDGVNYVLRPSRRAIQAIERSLGRGLLSLAQDAARGMLSTDELATCVVEFMRAYGAANPDDPDVTTYRAANAEKVADLLYESGAGGVMARVTILLAGALSGGYTSTGEIKPTR